MKKQRIKRDRMLTNFMSLLLEASFFLLFVCVRERVFVVIERDNKRDREREREREREELLGVAGPADRNLLLFFTLMTI
ncbi:hypothetical protein RIF29_15997 [Crotalaria pallida]|uniref:Uncharacterized protein n=1 Tax=Crotalaria pallida TaxID=3830 RepID=A0AAN9FGF7_CROPI